MGRSRSIRGLAIGVATLFGAVALVLSLWSLDAQTPTATWSCGSLMSPDTHSDPGAGIEAVPPEGGRQLFLEGSVACAETRDVQQGRVLFVALAAMMALIPALSRRPAPTIAKEPV